MSRCSNKGKEAEPDEDSNVNQTIQNNNGIKYKLYIHIAGIPLKGILVMGSGNNESNPTPGSLDGAPENELCQKAAANGYAAAIVQYRKGPGIADWDKSAKMMGQDYDQCIRAISSEYGIDKDKSVVGGYSYASYMLLTTIAIDNTLSYCKGLLAACGSTDAWKAQNFKIPVYAISCSGNNEGDFNGRALFDQIPANSPIKAKSDGFTDNTCTTHCGGEWVDLLYNKMTIWLQ